MSFVNAGEFLPALGDDLSVAVSTDAATAATLLPEATRGYHCTAIGAPMYLNVGGSGVTSGANDRKLYLSAGETKEFRSLVDAQTHFSAYGIGGAGTMLITALNN